MRAAAISGPHPPPQGREAAQDRGLRSESAGLLQSGVHAPPGLTLGGSGPCQLLRSVMAAECPAETRSSPDRWGVQEQANERWRAQQDVCTGLGRKLGPGDGGSQEGRDEPAPPPCPGPSVRHCSQPRAFLPARFSRPHTSLLPNHCSGCWRGRVPHRKSKGTTTPASVDIFHPSTKVHYPFLPPITRVKFIIFNNNCLFLSHCN